MLQGGGSPDFNLGVAASHDPFSENDQSSDAVNATAGKLELGDLFSTLKDPHAAFRVVVWSRPGGEYNLLPCQCRRNILGRLGPCDEDEVESALEIVCLEGAADRGCDLEGSLSERERGEGNVCGRDKAYGL